MKFCLELFQRMLTQNPKFFKVIQVIALLVGSLSAVVVYLSDKITLPDWTSAFNDVNLVVNAVLAMVMAQLPNKK